MDILNIPVGVPSSMSCSNLAGLVERTARELFGRRVSVLSTVTRYCPDSKSWLEISRSILVYDSIFRHLLGMDRYLFVLDVDWIKQGPPEIKALVPCYNSETERRIKLFQRRFEERLRRDPVYA